jgi:hypothetical protein
LQATIAVFTQIPVDRDVPRASGDPKDAGQVRQVVLDGLGFAVAGVKRLCMGDDIGRPQVFARNIGDVIIREGFQTAQLGLSQGRIVRSDVSCDQLPDRDLVDLACDEYVQRAGLFQLLFAAGDPVAGVLFLGEAP